LLQLLHTDVLMFEINSGVVAYNLWQASLLNMLVKVCTLAYCMQLRAQIDTVTLLMLMAKIGDLDF
jgi:hypothetical protein